MKGLVFRSVLFCSVALCSQISLACVYVEWNGVPGKYFIPFSKDQLGIEPQPVSLAKAMLAQQSSINILSDSVLFQGNTGDAFKYKDRTGLFIPPDQNEIILGSSYSVNGENIRVVNDASASLYDLGYFSNVIGIDAGGESFGFALSGAPDWDFTGNHEYFGYINIYLSVLDGNNDPFVSSMDFSNWQDGLSYFQKGYDPSTHADLTISTRLDPGAVLDFYFDPGSAANGDGSWTIDGQANEDEIQSFLNLVDDGSKIVGVMGLGPSDFHGSASYVKNLNLGNGVDFGNGILLTNGSGTPPDENTYYIFSGYASEQNDQDLNGLLSQSGISPDTMDTTALEFEFTVPDGAEVVSFDFMVGSESENNDIGAIIIDGQSYSVTNRDGVLGESYSLGVSISGTLDEALLDNRDGHLSIEYDYLTSMRHIEMALDPSLNVHTFKAAVSDVGYDYADTGIFIANFDVVGSPPAVLEPREIVLLGIGLLGFLVGNSREALIKAIPGFIRARCAANAVCGLLQNQSLAAIDFAGTSLCRGKV